MGDAAEKYIVEASENHHNLLSKVIGEWESQFFLLIYSLLIYQIFFIVLLGCCSESKAREVRMYSYGKNIDGFVARLLPNEVEMLSRT